MKHSLFSRVFISFLLCMMLCVSVLSGFTADKSVASQTAKPAAPGSAMNLRCDIGPGFIFYIFDLVQSVLVPDKVPERHDWPNFPHNNGGGNGNGRGNQ